MTIAASQMAPCRCTCCTCKWLDDRWAAGQFDDLKVKFSGALSGECILVPNSNPPDDGCVWWEHRDLDHSQCLNDPCPLNVSELYFLCPGDEPCQKYVAEIVMANIGCNPKNARVEHTSLTCPPDGPFEAVFRWELVEDGLPETAGRCCGYTEIIATITEP